MRTLLLTPEDNVKDQAVIGDDKIIQRDYPNHCMVNVKKGNKESNINFANISLYDHLLIIDGIKYHILHMFSKGD